jgi:hypothetical protein
MFFIIDIDACLLVISSLKGKNGKRKRQAEEE